MSDQSTDQLSIASTARTQPVRRARLINWLALGLALFWLILIATTLDPKVDDSKQFWQGAVDLLQRGDPYASRRDFTPAAGEASAADQVGAKGYKYTPIFAYLTQPLGLLSSRQNQWVWFGINIIALAALIVLCVRLSGSHRARHYWGVVVLGMLIAPPTRLSLQLGQTSIMLALLLVASYALARKHSALSGLLLALASLVKLYPALLGLFFLLRRPRAVAWWSIMMAMLVVGLFIPIYGVTHYDSFLHTVIVSSDHPYAAEFNISLLGFWTRLLAVTPYAVPVVNWPQLARLMAVFTSALVLGLCLWASRKPTDEIGRLAEFGVWLCATLLLSPINGTYNLVLLLLPLLATLSYLEQHRDRALRNWLLLGTALACVPAGWSNGLPTLYNTVHVGWWVLLLTPAFYGQSIYLVLLVVLARRHTPKATVKAYSVDELHQKK